MSQRGIKDVPGFRKDAADFADRFIGLQKEDFRRLGVLADWEKPYKTMEKEYEAEVVGAFRKLLKKGLIYRGLKPVYWCISCETALAEAEIEYKDKTSPSVYVALRITEGPKELIGKDVLIWTTTPWTLPANRAVAVNPDLRYVSLAVGDRKVLVAENRAEAVKEKIGGTKIPGFSLSGAELTNIFGRPNEYFKYQVPYGQNLQGPLLHADYVTMEDGTGIVHTAPGHGADDFQTGQANGLETFCPVDASGRFTAEAPEFLRSQKVFPEGNALIIEDLKKRGMLLHQENITHSYPHCWRCKNPIIFRATEQWFMTMDHSNLRGRILKEIDDSVRWVPEAGKSRISAMVQNRPDWCLSRQRLWGTPIPVLYCAACKKPIKDDKTIESIEAEIRSSGDDFWFKDWESEVDHKLWPFLPENLKCDCGSEKFHREKDILDVWMDSGMSWTAVLKQDECPADLYLEGSDQHRGWFQSSLVLSTGINGKAPYKSVLTHGFVLDEKGRAMHKSAGNVVSPQDIIKKYGADILRLWVAFSDYSDDVRISDKILEGPIEGYRKIRNTLRYLLGNTFDLKSWDKNKISFPPLEKYMLGLMGELQKNVLSDYSEFKFRSAARRIIDFCAFDLSAFYCDILKDRLYTFKPDHPDRVAAQAVLAEALIHVCALASPILPFTMEEAWAEGPAKKWNKGESVLLHTVAPEPDFKTDEALSAQFSALRKIREAAQKKLEEARSAGLIGSSLEAKIFLKGTLPNLNVNWAEILIVSQCEFAPGGPEIEIVVSRADGKKCPRCWRYQTDIGSSSKHPDLCGRCAQALG